MCGDHPMDVAAGKAAGARTVAVVYAGAAIGRDAFVGQHAPDFLLASVTELLHRLPARPCSSLCAGRQMARRHG
jgi:phosphoglycolate phosphatase-like HAD superfamily hydrolase